MIIDLHAHFHSDSALYPDSSLQSDSGLSQGGTDSGLHPHSCLLVHPWFLAFLVDTLIHVILISAYPAVRVKFYAYVNMLVIINKLTYYLLESKAVCKPATTRREDTNARNNANDSFGKGFDVLKDHVLNRFMTGRCPPTSLQLRPKFHSLFLQNSFDFQI